MTIITQDLPVALSESEIAERKRIVLGSALERAHIEARIDELKKVAKQHANEVEKAARELRDGVETRPVRCREVQVFEQNVVEIRREDTDEVVSTRAMTGADRQISIVSEDATAPKRKLKAAKESPPEGAPDAAH